MKNGEGDPAGERTMPTEQALHETREAMRRIGIPEEAIATIFEKSEEIIRDTIAHGLQPPSESDVVRKILVPIKLPTESKERT